MKKVPISGKLGVGKYTLVDDDDFERVIQHKWYLVWHDNRYYVANNKRFKLHWFILNTKWIDHKDNNPLNNTKENLRPCNKSQNNMNMVKRIYNSKSSSKFKGVYLHAKNKKWIAQINITGNAKPTYLGSFINELDAAKAYNNAAIIHFKEFAKLNKVD